MVVKKPLLTRATALALTLSLAVVGLAPALFVGSAEAAGLITSRKITLSSSSSAGSSATTTYALSFAAATTMTSPTVKKIVVQFCDNTPIPMHTTCTAPTGFSVGASPSYDNLTFNAGANQSGWTTVSRESNTAFEVSHATGVAITAGQIITLNMLNIQNPTTTNHTFYARVYVYSSNAGTYSIATPDNGNAHIDDGGIALSTAAQIVVTGKVQERLTFCVYTGANCGAGGTAINLGDTNGVLDYAHDYTSIAAKFDISTNALSGANVILKGGTLTSGGNTITAMGASAVAATQGTEQFGMCLWESTAGDSNFTPASPYNHASCNTVTTGMDANGSANFAFDSAVTGGSTGDDIGTKAAGTSSTATMAFVGNITASTQAGIYTTTLTFIATGTY